MNLTLDPDEYVERLHQNIKSTWNQGAEHERERIIKLLEENEKHYGCAWDCPQPCHAPTFAELIALIKGEQK